MIDEHLAKKRTARIAKLDSVRRMGARAERIMDGMQPVIDEIRGIYLRQLVENTKEAGEPDTYTVWQLVVLSDMETMLKEQAGRGARAAEKLRDLSNAGGSDT